MKLCLDAKHWDPNVWTFARRIAFICPKFSPNCIRGTLTPKILVHIFSLLIVREFTSTSLPPPPPLLSSCLVPLAHRFPRRRCCRCSLLIVVCPRRCHCHRCRLCFQHRHCRPPSGSCCHDFRRRNSCHRVVMIVIAVPVAVVDNDAVPSPHCSLRRRLSPSLLSQCFLRRHCHCLHFPTAVNGVAVSAAAATYLPPWL